MAQVSPTQEHLIAKVTKFFTKLFTGKRARVPISWINLKLLVLALFAVPHKVSLPFVSPPHGIDHLPHEYFWRGVDADNPCSPSVW